MRARIVRSLAGTAEVEFANQQPSYKVDLSFTLHDMAMVKKQNSTLAPIHIMHSHKPQHTAPPHTLKNESH